MFISKEGWELIRAELFRRGRLFLLTVAVMVVGISYYFGVYKWENYGPGNKTNLYGTVFFAVIHAAAGFSWLFSMKRTGFYFSLPVKRRTVYYVNYILGILQYVLPFFLYTGACGLVLYAGGGAGGEQILQNFIWANIIGVMVYLLFYHLTLFAILLSGSAVSAVIAFLAFAGVFELLIRGVVYPYCSMFFRHYYQIPIWDQVLGYISPFQISANMAGLQTAAGALQGSFEPRPGYLCAGAIVIAVLFVLCHFLFRTRKAETAGNPYFHKKVECFLKILLLIPASLLCGYFFLFCFQGTVAAGILGIVIGGVLGFYFLHILFYGTLRRAWEKRKGVVPAILTASCICIFFAAGREPYDMRVPSAEGTKEIGVVLSGVDELYVPEAESVSSVKAKMEHRLSNRMMRAEGKALAIQYIDSLEKGNDEEKAFTKLYVSWKEETGGTVYRIYPVTEEEAWRFQTLYANQEYKDALYKRADTGEADLDSRTFIWSNGVEEYMLSLDKEEKKKLADLYQKELRELSLKIVSGSRPCGVLQVRNEIMGLTQTSYLYPEFTETAAFLKKLGIPVEKKIADYEITRIIKNRYDENGYVRTREVLNQEDIIKAKNGLFVCDYYIHPLFAPIPDTSMYEVYIKEERMQTVDRLKAYFSMN